MFGFGKEPDKIIKRGAARKERETVANTNVQNVFDTNSQTDKKVAQQKYKHAKAIYEETRNPEHWEYMQRCIDKL